MSYEYMPVSVEPVKACQWRYDNTESVAHFIAFLQTEGIAFSFEAANDGTYEVEVDLWKGAELALTVEHRRWFVIEPGGAWKVMSDHEFSKMYRRP